MMGRNHAASGALAFAVFAAGWSVLDRSSVDASGGFTWSAALAGMAVASGAALLPDLDHPGSSLARSLGPLTKALAWVVNKLSGGHRNFTHGVLGVFAFTAGAYALTWLPLGMTVLAIFLAAFGLKCARLPGFRAKGWLRPALLAGALVGFAVWVGHVPAWTVVAATGIGAATHLAGDAVCGGVPLAHPISDRRYGTTWFRVGSDFERRRVSPVLALAAILAGPGAALLLAS